MAIISEVKCGRCDRRYSGFRSRCPYCGARRSGRGKHADDVVNSKANIIIGSVLLIVLIAAAMILIFTSLPDKVDNTSVDASASPSTSDVAVIDSGETVTSIDASASPDASANVSGDVSASPSDGTDVSASPSPSDTSHVTITAVSIVASGTGKVAEDVTIAKIGGTEKFRIKTTPETTGKVAVWESSDTDVFTVVDGKVTAMGKGSATLKVTVDGITAKCVIRCSGK